MVVLDRHQTQMLTADHPPSQYRVLKGISEDQILAVGKDRASLYRQIDHQYRNSLLLNLRYGHDHQLMAAAIDNPLLIDLRKGWMKY